MRQAKKEIRDRMRIMKILERAPVGRLGTIGPEGYPMIKPVNFACLGGRIYFHSAPAGEKIDDIVRNGNVCFEVDEALGYRSAVVQACDAGYFFRSVIVRGRASIVRDREEKLAALDALMRKYQPEGGYAAAPEEKLAITAVVRIDIDKVTGKEDVPDTGRER